MVCWAANHKLVNMNIITYHCLNLAEPWALTNNIFIYSSCKKRNALKTTYEVIL